MHSPGVYKIQILKKGERDMQSNETLHIPVRWGILSAANIGVKRVAPAIHASSNGKLVAVGSRTPGRANYLHSHLTYVFMVTMTASSVILR